MLVTCNCRPRVRPEVRGVVLHSNTNQAEVRPRQKLVPSSNQNVRYSGSEWQELLAKQELRPEVYPNFKPGTVRQIDGAGAIRGDSQDPKIIGGEDAATGQFPWQVSMTVDDSWFCGGSVISDVWVLTAAHCANRASTFLLGFGTLTPDASGAGSEVRVATTYTVHEDYQAARILNDVAVIMLDTPLVWSAVIGPVRLPSRSQATDPMVGEIARVSGWGLTSDDAQVISPTLKFVDLVIISNAECLESFNGVLDNQVCTSGAGGKSICSGDSGGPLVLQEADGLYTEIGVVSYGASVCEQGFPQGYSRVTSFLDWIETNTGIIVRD